MSDLVEFLRARIAEDEQAARAADGPAWEPGDGNVSEGGLYANEWSIAWFELGETNPEQRIAGANWQRHAHDNSVHAARHDPARVLAECEAKRQIIEREHVECAGHPGPWLPHGDYGAGYCARGDEENWILRYLALPYAGHRDWRDGWRP